MSRSGVALTHSTQERRKIKEVRITVFGAEDLRAYSVCEVFNPNMKNLETGEYYLNSLADPRLGPKTLDHRCATCECDTKNCPGHFGHINLAKPIYHFGFVEVVKKILSCICYQCSRLKVPKDKDKLERIRKIKENKSAEFRFNQLYKQLRDIKECKAHDTAHDTDMPDEHDDIKKTTGCGAKQPKYTVEKNEYVIIQDFSNVEPRPEDIVDPKMTLSAEKALYILKRISDEDCKALGFEPGKNKPSNLILEAVPVSPPQTRPSVDTGTGIVSEDDLTYQYRAILNANQAVKDAVEAGQTEANLNERIRVLQFFVTTLARNDLVKKSQHTNGRPIKSIRDRISSKEGRIRGNLMGKRVDFSARTVISPDPNLALDELGVPRTIAAGLTFPETVTERNFEKLERLVKKSTPWAHPGAKFVRKKTGHIFDLREAKEINLEYGDIVDRHIDNGDYVLFNRQPSLHKMSMMAHRIRVLPYSSFRLNLSVTKPYNADFDGDEMNMHVPQSYETRAELKEIMHVPRQIVAPKSNQPVMAIEQDALTGIRLYTKRNVFLNVEETMNLMMHLPNELWDGKLPEPAILKPKRLWTGKQLYSKLLDDTKINVEAMAAGAIKAKAHNHPGKDMKKDEDEIKKEENNWQDVEVLIQRGELLKGILDSKTVGQSKKGLVHIIWLEYGHEKARQFLTNTQKMVNNWFASHAYTIGISDTICSQKTFDSIAETLSELTGKVANILSQCERGDLEFQPGKGLLDSLEVQVNEILNKAREEASGKLTNDLDQRNNILHMVNAGSKGKTDNLSQIIACVGQQNVEGKRIPFGFVQRSLPHFTKFDYGARSRGFVNRCYLKGLTPEEFYFHTMGGREGLIDTAVKTAETGYIQRKLVKALEDVMVKYDGTVRDCNGNIIQFLYGEDGMAGEFIEEVRMDLIDYNNAKMKKEFEITSTMLPSMDEEDEIAANEEIEQLVADRDVLRELFPDYKKKDFHLPVDISRLITNAIVEFKIRKNTVSDLTVKDVIGMQRELSKSLVIVVGTDRISREMQESCTLLFNIYVRFMLCSKKVILVHKLTREAFNNIIGVIENYFGRCRSHPGEMVGAIAAQSISEPTTQMTLNTFHNAGISSKNVTLGVPRVKEIINKANTKTPSLTLFLNDPFKYDEKSFSKLSHDLAFTNLKSLAYRSEIFYDQDPLNSIINDTDFDSSMNYQLLHFDEIEAAKNQKEKLSPWVLRILLRKDIDFNMARGIQDILFKKISIVLRPTSGIKFLYTSDEFYLNLSKDAHPEIRILMFRQNPDQIVDEFELLKKVEENLFKLINISGLDKIFKVYTKNKTKDKTLIINPDDGAIKPDKDTQYYFETDGSDLRASYQFDYIDHRITNCNDINEVYRVLGIEAARRSILDEIRKVMNSYGIYINFRHLSILCDTMCHRGYIMPINRNGINRIDCGPLRKCSFEETLEMLLNSAAFGKTDPLNGISENIMLGQLCRIGTGYFDLIIDNSKLKEPRYIPSRFNILDNEDDRPDDDGHIDGGFMTPVALHTPNPYTMGMTPSNYGGDTGQYLGGGFTPSHMNSMASPIYTPNRVANSPSIGTMMSPMYPVIGGPKSPGYLPGTPQSANSPSYSPIGSAIYNPISPGYSPSASPSLSSSDRGKAYSPSSPTYSNSPRYSPNYSPRSPGYSPSNSGTPGSQPLGSNSYTPNTPSYNKGGVYVPTSPGYDPNQPIHEKDDEDDDDDEDEDNKKKKK